MTAGQFLILWILLALLVWSFIYNADDRRKR